jgi:hypothetical protein
MFQMNKSFVSGYKLYDRSNGLWQMQTPNGIFSGSLRMVCKYAVLRLDFHINELEIGVLEMEKHFHNAAEYGIYKSFMWSYDLEDKNDNA